MKAESKQIQQGTAEWHEHRAMHFNASEAAAMLGLSSYKTRAELLREKATGIVPEIDAATQARFDKGHEYEAIARTWADDLIGSELYPMVYSAEVDGLPLSASLDGITLLEDVTFEHKSLNKALAIALEAGEIPDEYWPQMEQGLLLTGADNCLFMASNGDRETMRYALYKSRPNARAKLLAGWKQFAVDLANYQHEPIPQEVVAAPQMELPAVFIQVAGSIALTDNLTKFGEALTAYVGNINKAPETDQDFADLEACVKVLRNAEDALDSAESGALAQTDSIDSMRRTVAQYRALARDTRLMLDKLVKNEKDNRKAEIVRNGREKLAEHVKGLNGRIGGQWMPVIEANFAGVIKGLKTLSSCKEKVSNELARATIEADEIAYRIQANRKNVEEAERLNLFPDFHHVCTKTEEDFGLLLQSRIMENDARLERERESIRREEAAKLAMQQAEQDQRGKAAQTYSFDDPDTSRLRQNGGGQQTAHADGRAMPDTEAASTPPDNGARMKLGDICNRLGFTVSADFLASLGHKPAAQEKNAKLYRECDFPGICAAIVRHIQAVSVVE